jgi:hypothetical protein
MHAVAIEHARVGGELLWQAFDERYRRARTIVTTLPSRARAMG